MLLSAMVGIGAFSAVAAPAVAGPSSRVVPVAGDWEGTGADGIPLSFQLTRRHGRIIATAVALGSQGSCPAIGRDARTTPLERVAYAGPGGAYRVGLFASAAAASLSGRLSYDPNFTAAIVGGFTSSRTGRFETGAYPHSGCGWPKKLIIWNVHAAKRLQVADASWTAELSGPADLTSGSVQLSVVGSGRVVKSLSGSFNCQYTDSYGIPHQADEEFAANPTYEFIHANGAFYSPVASNLVYGHPTTWQGAFSASGGLSGILDVYDPCTQGVTQMTFSASGPAG
jgi:hypothetical protein